MCLFLIDRVILVSSSKRGFDFKNLPVDHKISVDGVVSQRERPALLVEGYEGGGFTRKG